MLSAIIGAAGSVLGGALSGVGGSILGNYFGRKNASDSASMNYHYYQRQRMFDALYNNTYEIPTQKDLTLWNNAVEYDLAQAYAENSASWQVQGLRNANLNPILAATGGNISGSFGAPSTVASSSVSGGSMPRNAITPAKADINMDLSAALQMLSSAKLLDSQANAVKEKTDAEVGLLKAQTLKATADSKVATATEWKTRNDIQSNAMQGLKDMLPKVGSMNEKIILPPPTKAELMLRKNPGEHSAKDYSFLETMSGEGLKAFKEEWKKEREKNRPSIFDKSSWSYTD